jgi:hypothetical protein
VDVQLRPARGAGLASLIIGLSLVAASPAAAQSQPGSTGSGRAAGAAESALGETTPPVSERRAIRIARRDPKVDETRDRYGQLSAVAEQKPGVWQVGFFADGAERVQVVVDQNTGEVRESWTGYQVAWQMARGYSGQFGHKLDAPYVWLPLCAIFLLGLVEWRRPWRLAHLDLLVLLAFGVSHVFFNDAEIGVSVPLVYPVLLYLLARMLWAGFRGVGPGLRPSAPVTWLAIATVFLLGFRVALNIADSGVIDVGYAGVIGADRITHGDPIYGTSAFTTDNPFGDTYGPANYYAYVPFELALPWSGSWDQLPAAHAAAIFFDLAVVAGLFMLGRRLRPGPSGRDLGFVLAFAWAAYPYSDFALQSNSNDSLVAALIVWALVLARPAARGGMLGLATMTKFAPLALAPLFATGERSLVDRPPWRPIAAFSGGLVVVMALMLVHPAIDPGLATFWDRTVGSQVVRESPFSIWGQVSLGPLQVVAQILAAGLGILVAFVPRRRSLAQVAALGAAVLIAVQLTADHWFYLYIPWFFPLLIAALAAGTMAECREVEAPAAATKPEPAPVAHVADFLVL